MKRLSTKYYETSKKIESTICIKIKLNNRRMDPLRDEECMPLRVCWCRQSDYIPFSGTSVVIRLGAPTFKKHSAKIH